MPEEAYYPMAGYIYRADGYHHGPKYLENEQELEEFMKDDVKNAMVLHREVRITDPGDRMLFHAENGVIKWP